MAKYNPNPNNKVVPFKLIKGQGPHKYERLIWLNILLVIGLYIIVLTK